MNKILSILILSICLAMAACNSHNEEPEPLDPIQFSQQDYTIIYGGSNGIPFTGGGYIYKLEASNPEVLGRFGIDIETHRLIISPAKTGKSTLKIVDVNVGNTVTLNITVDDYYLPFKIAEIDGANTNEYFITGNYIRFIRDENNTKLVKIVFQNHLNFRLRTVAEGIFNIDRNEANIFTMTISLQGIKSENVETYEYTMGGDGEYMNIFDKLFDFNWDSNIDSSRSSQPREIKMILTDNSNGCRITCEFQPLKLDY